MLWSVSARFPQEGSQLGHFGLDPNEEVTPCFPRGGSQGFGQRKELTPLLRQHLTPVHEGQTAPSLQSSQTPE